MSIHRSSQPGLERTMRIGSPGLVAHGSYSFAHPIHNSAIPIQYKQFSQKLRRFLGTCHLFYTYEYPLYILFYPIKLNQIFH